MRVTFLPLAVALFGCGAAPPPPETPAPTESVPDAQAETSGPWWEECTISERGPRLRTAECEGFDLRLMHAETLHGRTGLQYLLDRASAAAGSPVDAQERPLGPRALPAAEFSQGGYRWLMAATQDGMLFSCRAVLRSGLETCESRILQLEADGVPDVFTSAPPQQTILGRALIVPAGCALRGDNRLTCPAAEFHFRESVRPGLAAENLAELLQEQLEAIGPTAATPAGCFVLGEVGEGVYFEVQVGDEVLRVVTCSAQFEDVRVDAQCNLLSEAHTHFPEPCSQVFGDGPLP